MFKNVTISYFGKAEHQFYLTCHPVYSSERQTVSDYPVLC